MNKAEQLVKLLIEKKYTVSFAESCTGGKMAARIVDVPDGFERKHCNLCK